MFNYETENFPFHIDKFQVDSSVNYEEGPELHDLLSSVFELQVSVYSICNLLHVNTIDFLASRTRKTKQYVKLTQLELLI